jgi:glycosyltransferase involved in cell wall biosynthesis
LLYVIGHIQVKTLRILHVIPHYYPAVRYGGPIRSVHGLASASAVLGDDVHVFTTNVDGGGVVAAPTGVPVDRDGVKVWYFPISTGRRIYRSVAMQRALDAALPTFDIAHIHYIWVWPTVSAAATARKHGVPYILAPRGMLVADLIRRKSMLAKRLWLTLFTKRDIEQAAAIHVTSLSEANSLRGLGLSFRRVEIVENGTDFPAEEKPASGAASQLLLSRPYILFLGRISWKKGLDRLLRALALVEGVDLVIAGYDENGYSEEMRRLAAELGLADRVHFAGPVEDDMKWTFIRSALCLVLPSYNENFGMAVLEAMAVGCPAVVTEEVGLADVVRESGGGIVTPGDPHLLAQAIASVIASPEKRLAMGMAGIRTAQERYGWQSSAKAMQAVYLQCLQDCRRKLPFAAEAATA